MFIFGPPFVTEFLSSTAIKNNLPLLFEDAIVDTNPQLRDVQHLRVNSCTNTLASVPERFLCNHPSAIKLLKKYAPNHEAVKNSDSLSDKYLFRSACRNFFPKLQVVQMSLPEILQSDTSPIEYPCVVKPRRGIGSVGVFKCTDDLTWNKAMKNLQKLVEQQFSIAYKNALDFESYVIESFISGNAYAFDAYFDETGQPIVLTINQHLFAYDGDVSDTVYCTNKDIISNNIDAICKGLAKVGSVFRLKNFAVHAELRINKQGELQFIEVNPTRFAGISICKLPYYAYGINSLEYFFNNEKPDWDKLLGLMGTETYCTFEVVSPANIDQSAISVDVESMSKEFRHVLDFQEFPFQNYLVKGLFFLRCSSFEEAQKLLDIDIGKYFSYKRLHAH